MFYVSAYCRLIFCFCSTLFTFDVFAANWVCFTYPQSSAFEISLLDMKGFTVCFCNINCFVLRHFMNRIFWSIFIPICTAVFLCHGQIYRYESVNLTDIILRALFVEDKRFYCCFSCSRRIHDCVVERHRRAFRVSFSYLGDPGFKYRFGDRLQWLLSFMVSSTLSSNVGILP
jgi:hypothetical protein